MTDGLSRGRRATGRDGEVSIDTVAWPDGTVTVDPPRVFPGSDEPPVIDVVAMLRAMGAVVDEDSKTWTYQAPECSCPLELPRGPHLEGCPAGSDHPPYTFERGEGA